MTEDDRTRKAFEDYYAGLSPEERRERIFLNPAFRDPYNEITDAHRVVQVPRYFWVHWVPTLGPVASTLYMKLRQYCYYNSETGERRDWCWPKQETLASEIGVKDRTTIRKALGLLEEHGFIRRERTYYKDPKSGRPHQGTDRYLVYFEIPLVVADAVELLVRKSLKDAPVASYEAKKSPHRSRGVEKSAYEAKKSTHGGGDKIATNKYLEQIPKNVNVATHADEESSRVRAMVDQMVEELADPGSRGFFRLVAHQLPEYLIYRALSETKDARLTGKVRKTPGAYFTHLVKTLAAEYGLELSIQSALEPQEGP